MQNNYDANRISVQDVTRPFNLTGYQNDSRSAVYSAISVVNGHHHREDRYEPSTIVDGSINRVRIKRHIIYALIVYLTHTYKAYTG